MGGKGGPKVDKGMMANARESSDLLQDFGLQLWRLGKPARSKIMTLLNDALAGGDQLKSRFFNPIAGQIESQTEESKRRLMSMMPQGGALDRGLIDLERNRVGTRAAANTQITQSLFDQAMDTAFGRTVQPALGAISGSGQAANQVIQNQMQADEMKYQRQMEMMRMIAQLGASGGQGLAMMKSPTPAQTPTPSQTPTRNANSYPY